MIWLKRLCLFIGALLLLGVLTVGFWVGAKIVLYDQQDDATHLTEKKRYLESIGKLDRSTDRPNIVFILFDDLGYGDLGMTGSQAIKTPTIDKLASGGLTMTNFYSPAPVCTPSRAGYLTGRFPVRAGMPLVLFPSSSPINNANRIFGVNNRFPAEEITLADTLKASGYATGMVGKWHLGDQSPSLPNDMGFDSFFGALYSNDMTPFALYRNKTVAVEAPADQSRLNEWYGREAEQFISNNKEEPFFLYLAHNFPHIPLYVPDEDKRRSSGGLYGDVVEGLDDVVARVITSLKANGVYENTIVLITSDNGPWFQGSPGHDRGRKADTFEGGMHVPMVVHWPARFKQGRSVSGLSMGMDWYPTLLDWLDIPLPTDRTIDGKSLTAMLEDGQGSPHDYLYYFDGENLRAVRDERYKYHDEPRIPYAGGTTPVAARIAKGPWLFDMMTDHNESYDISVNQPDKASSMHAVLEAKRNEMLENPRGWISSPP